MNRELAVRALGLYVPIAVAGALWAWRRFEATTPRDSSIQPTSRRIGAGVLLACAWNTPALLALHLLATHVGWWSFHATGGQFAGIPLDLYLGWIVLWGAVPALAFLSLPLPLVAVAMLGIDLLLMPLCKPVVELGAFWLVGEAAAIGLVLLPAQYLARWTIADRHLAWRAVLQAIAFSGLMLLVIPTAILEQTGGSWRPLLDRSPRWNNLLAQLLAIPAIVGLSAVQEFAVRGRGTPIPYDPPRRLVTTGPYAYVANPMQLAIAWVFVAWAVMLGSVWLVGASIVAVAYSAGLAAWHEDEQLLARYGDAWSAYRRDVRRWLPRWRPRAQIDRVAHLYVAETCATCRGVGEWLAGRNVVGLQIVAAERHPTRDLSRITYEPPSDGPIDEGVAAFARALEHIHLGWALVGMFIRLPLVRPLVQLIVNASGGYSRRIARLNGWIGRASAVLWVVAPLPAELLIQL